MSGEVAALRDEVANCFILVDHRERFSGTNIRSRQSCEELGIVQDSVQTRQPQLR